MNALGRHPNVLIAVLLAAVAVLVIVAVVGLGAPATSVPLGAASTSVPTVPPTPTPPPVVAVPGGAVPPAKDPPPAFADCGRYSAQTCARVIELAMAGNEADLVGTSRIVVDDTCPPESQCDHQFPFDAIAVFATAGGDTTGWYAFHVFGLGDVPTTAEPWTDEIPRHISERLQASQPVP